MKRRINSKNRDFKSCLSARSKNNRGIIYVQLAEMKESSARSYTKTKKERKKGTRRDIEREGEISEKERESERERER